MAGNVPYVLEVLGVSDDGALGSNNREGQYATCSCVLGECDLVAVFRVVR